jgi:hypothetical protein
MGYLSHGGIVVPNAEEITIIKFPYITEEIVAKRSY